MDKSELIIKLIKDAGFPSIKSFAEKCGLPYTTLHSMLKRGIGNASVDNVISVCKNLGITVEQLENFNLQDTPKYEQIKVKSNKTLLIELKNKYNLSLLEFAILESYLKLGKKERATFIKFFDGVMNLKLKYELPDGIYDLEDKEIEKVSEEIFEEDENNNHVNTKKESSKIG